MTRIFLVFALVCCWIAPSFARADSLADEAEVNFRLGAERYQAGDFRTALAYFLQSNRLAPNRNVRFNIARAFQRLGLYPEAHRFCLAALEGDVPEALRIQLEETRTAIEREVSILDIQTAPGGATIYVDREDLGSVAVSPSRIAVSPGEHRVIATLDGYETLRSDPVLTERGKAYPISLSLTRIVGYVDVVAPSGTEIRADSEGGEPLCLAPCTLSLSPGGHVLYMNRPGFRIDPQQVRVTAQARTKVSATPIPLTGSIVVTTDERDALVEVDGVPAGFTPTVLRNVAVGERRVRVSLRGFRPVERVVTVSVDRPAELRGIVLAPAREVTAAARVAQAIDDAPASVSVISNYEIEAFRYPTISEALRGQRGVALSNDGVYSSVSVRGLGQPGDYGNRLLVLNDGASLNDNIVWQSYVGYDGRADLGGVERIELVRGAGSVLYGTGAVTGVVNVVPEAPFNNRSVEARVTASDERTARARAATNLPWGARGGVSLSAAGAHGEGEEIWLNTRPTDTRVASFDAFDAGTVQARLTHDAWTLQAFGTVREQRTPQGAYGAVIGDDRNRLRDTRGLVEARFEPKLGKRVTLFTRAFGNAYRFSGTNVYRNGEATSLTFVRERYRGDWLGAEARIMVEAGAGLRLTIGTEGQANAVASLKGENRINGVATAYLDENKPYQTYAAYALSEWDVAKALTVLVGARVDAWSTFGATTNPRAAVIVRPSARDTIKLMGGRAFRAPSVYELRYNDGGNTQIRSDAQGNKLAPELVWSAELEHTHRFQDGWLLLTSLHVQRAEDLIEQGPVNAAINSPVIYRNANTVVRTFGGDLEVRRELGAGWTVTANYGYLAARYKHTEPGWFDTRVPNAPNHFGSVRGIAPIAQRLRLAARATFEAPRRVRLTSGDETERAVIADVVLTGDVPSSGLDYALGLYNAFDSRYALPAEATFVTRTMPQAGRTLLLSLGLRR